MDFERSRYLRKQRREGILLALVGGIFVGLGILTMAIGNPWMGVVGVPFFGACFVLGLMQAVRPGEAVHPAVAILGSFGFAVSGALLIVGHLLEIPFLGHRQAMALPVGVIVFGFFGPGAVLLVVREMRRRRRNR